MYYTNVLQFLEEQAASAPDKIAFADPDQEISFEDLLRHARAIGNYLASRIPVGAPVAFYMEKCVPAICGMFGAVYAGGFYSFIDVRQPEARAQKVFDVLEPAVVITDSSNADKLSSITLPCEVLRVEDLCSSSCFNAAQDGTVPNGSGTVEEVLMQIRRNVTDTAPLYVNFTSGSTGTPKGVAVCHRSVIEFISHFAPLFGITGDDVIANQAPFDFDVSVKDIYSGLFTGAKVQIIPREYFSAPATLMDYLAENRVTVLIWAVSAMCFVSIMNGLQYRLPADIRLIMFSGEVMPPKQLAVWRKYLPDAVYVNLYGPTEITCNCTYYILEHDREYSPSDVIPAGIPFPNEKVLLLDEQDCLIPADKPDMAGEICVAGTCLALGYYRDPEKTAQAFVQNPLNTAFPELIYRTGDLGKYNAHGNLIYISRKDFQIKHMGHRIELGEIEADAMALEGVERACCLYDTAKKRLLLFYTGAREKKDLESELRGTLPPFMIPNKIFCLEEMPLNKNGKIDRNALMEY